MIEKFFNEFGDKITFYQATSSKFYRKMVYDDDMRLQSYEESISSKSGVQLVLYKFVQPGENHLMILESLPQTYDKYVLYFNVSRQGIYSIYDWEEFTSSKVLKFKGKTVFDENYRIIFDCSLDLVTGSLLPNAEKYFYGNDKENQYDNILLEFVYDETGDIVWIIDVNENFGYIRGISLNEYLQDTKFSQIDFPWSQHPYYHSAYPFMPEGLV